MWAAMSLGFMAATRAAASSIASGMPSRRRQISATAAAFVGSIVNPARADAARCAKRFAASLCVTASSAASASGMASERTARICSPGSPMPSRLDARMRTPGQPRRIASASRHTSSSRCSQLSNTRSCDLARRNSTMLCSSVAPAIGTTPRVDATTWVRASASVAAASSQNQAPWVKRGSSSAATWRESRVLPTPPTPVSVTRRFASSAVATAASSASRPTNDVVWSGRLPGERVERPEPGELPVEAVDRDLEHPLGPGEVAQVVLAEIDELDAGKELVAHELRGQSRADDLAAVRRRHQARGTVEGRAEVVAVADLGRPGVQADPHPQRSGVGPRLGGQCPLQLDRRGHRRRRGRERREATVAGRLDDGAAVGADHVAEDLVVARQRRLHRVGVLLPEPRRPFEVGEHERHRPGRKCVDVRLCAHVRSARRSIRRCIATANASARLELVNATINPSPRFFTSVPPAAATAPRNRPKWV